MLTHDVQNVAPSPLSPYPWNLYITTLVLDVYGMHIRDLDKFLTCIASRGKQRYERWNILKIYRDSNIT